MLLPTRDPPPVFCLFGFDRETRCRLALSSRAAARAGIIRRSWWKVRAVGGATNGKKARGHVVLAPCPRASVVRRLSGYDTAPATGVVSSPFFSFSSVTSTSVVNANPMALAALSSAVRATLVGSMMPILNRSPNSPVAAL